MKVRRLFDIVVIGGAMAAGAEACGTPAIPLVPEGTTEQLEVRQPPAVDGGTDGGSGAGGGGQGGGDGEGGGREFW